jgi:hypothetical protein
LRQRTLRQIQKRNWDPEMKIKLGLRQTLISAAVFCCVILALVWVDPRVKERLQSLVFGGDGLTSWDNRALELGNALVMATQTQSIDKGPVMIFIVVGAVLFVCMAKA